MNKNTSDAWYVERSAQAYHARTSGFLPSDKIERAVVGNSYDAVMVRAVYGGSNLEFTDNLMKEEMHDQRRCPDRFILKAGSFGRKRRGK